MTDTQASGWTWDTVLWSPGVEPSGWLDIGWVTSLEPIRKELLEVRILNPATRFGPHCCGLRCRYQTPAPKESVLEGLIEDERWEVDRHGQIRQGPRLGLGRG